MTALQLLQYAAQILLGLIFVSAIVGVFKERTRTSFDIAMFFGLLGLLIIRPLVGLQEIPVIGPLTGALIYLLPYFMMRLLVDFATVPRWAALANDVIAAAFIVSALIVSTPAPAPVTLARTAYFVTVFLYTATAFRALARHSVGVTRRRMQAVSAGNLLFGIAILGAGLVAVLPNTGQTGTLFIVPALLAAAIAWLVGFAPPAGLRRYWQEPELRAFLGRAAALPRLPETPMIVRELERGASEALGARASIGLWDEDAALIAFDRPPPGLPPAVHPGERLPSWLAFDRQQPIFVRDLTRVAGTYDEELGKGGVGSVLAAPITAGERRLGVLRVHAPRPPLFSHDDLSLVVLLADQAAVILESRALIDEATRVKAQEEAAQLKEDFVSAAAHDLKTPLTTLVGQAQILERKFRRDPARFDDLPAIERIAGQAKRLGDLVEELLDASRVEQGKLELHREPIDLVDLAREVVARHRADGASVALSVRCAAQGLYDARRVKQLVSNLLENARKYSQKGKPIEVEVWREDGEGRLAVHDQGIGIPAQDLPHVFEKFRRAGNVDDRRYSGMGLGLYICQGIVEHHGGRIWVESTLGTGSVFHVALPTGEEGRLN